MTELNTVMSYQAYSNYSPKSADWTQRNFPKWLATQGVPLKSKFRLRHWVLLDRVATADYVASNDTFHNQQMQDILSEVRSYVNTHYYHMQLAGKEL